MDQEKTSVGPSLIVEDLEEYGIVGKTPQRSDVEDKVRGSALYLEDMRFSGMLFGKVLRSRYSHARILSIDTAKAEKLPGVRGVVTGEDFPFLHGESFWDEPFLARERVRYKGEAVAAIAAEDEATAQRAQDLITVEYQELPAVFDVVEAAGPEAPLIHENLETYHHAPGIQPIQGTNVCNHFELRKGDVEKGFAESDFTFQDTFTTPMQQHCTLEPHGSICRMSDDNKMTLWTNNDSPYRCLQEITRALKVPSSDVRIITAPTIGGNFGSKGGLKSEAPAIALAWKVRNRPIRVLYTREEEFCSSVVRHPSLIRIKTGVKKDGTILARQVEVYLATGAYAEKGPTVTRFAGVSAAGPYKIPNVKVDAYCVYTNKPVSGAFRGYSGPQTAWAYESQMDIIAHELGIDPLELRLRHVYEEGDLHNTGNPIYSTGLKECLERVSESMEWRRRPLERGRGLGIACMERTVKTPFGSAAFVKVNEDGTVDVLSSTTEVGQGSETILRQIAAEELGVPLEGVRKAAPDTAFCPFDASTTSSRSTFHMGNAVKMAAADAREQILEMAAPLLDRDSDDLAIKNGNVYVERRPESALHIAEVLSRHYGPCGTVLGKGYFIPQMPGESDEYYARFTPFWLVGAAGAEVQVNEKTGKVRVLKLWSGHDAGKVIHPMNWEGQIEGGVSTGLGFALSEEMLFEEGNVVNPSFLTYKLPSALDVPQIVPVLVEHPHSAGPYGAKGGGETTNVPVPPAIGNAIFDAVGVRIKILPITADKILEALKRKRREEKP